MKHKWHKEIKAWADGAEIEARGIDDPYNNRWELTDPQWDKRFDYRIKPQPVEVVATGQSFRFKEKKYLYVYADGDFFIHSQSPIGAPAHWQYFGKIEVQND